MKTRMDSTGVRAPRRGTKQAGRTLLPGAGGAGRVSGGRRLLPEARIRECRPTWQAAVLVFAMIAPPVFVVLTLIDWLLL